MNPYLILAVIAVPILGLGLLAYLMNRWGRKHDPMEPRGMGFLSTMGTETKNEYHQD